MHPSSANASAAQSTCPSPENSLRNSRLAQNPPSPSSNGSGDTQIDSDNAQAITPRPAKCQRVESPSSPTPSPQLASAKPASSAASKKKTTRARVEDLDPELVFSCTYKNCRKRFAKKYNLKIHERRHAGKLPFKCQQPDCEKRFMWRSSFLRHLRSHEPKPNGRKRRNRSSKLGSESNAPRDDVESMQTLPTVRLLSTTTSCVQMHGLSIVTDNTSSQQVNLMNALLVLNCGARDAPRVKFTARCEADDRHCDDMEADLASQDAEGAMADAHQSGSPDIAPQSDTGSNDDQDLSFDELGEATPDLLQPFESIESLLHD